jgi:hypothetical protein
MSAQFGQMPEEQLWPCCDSAAYTDGDRCTCWVVESVPEQSPLREGPPFLRRKACADCAYRADSAERLAGEEPNSANNPIYCHWDAPMVTRVVHPPSGVVIDYAPGVAYDPVQHYDRYWKADGRPGEYCAVWGALNAIRRASR